MSTISPPIGSVRINGLLILNDKGGVSAIIRAIQLDPFSEFWICDAFEGRDFRLCMENNDELLLRIMIQLRLIVKSSAPVLVSRWTQGSSVTVTELIVVKLPILPV